MVPSGGRHVRAVPDDAPPQSRCARRRQGESSARRSGGVRPNAVIVPRRLRGMGRLRALSGVGRAHCAPPRFPTGPIGSSTTARGRGSTRKVPAKNQRWGGSDGKRGQNGQRGGQSGQWRGQHENGQNRSKREKRGNHDRVGRRLGGMWHDQPRLSHRHQSFCSLVCLK